MRGQVIGIFLTLCGCLAAANIGVGVAYWNATGDEPAIVDPGTQVSFQVRTSSWVGSDRSEAVRSYTITASSWTSPDKDQPPPVIQRLPGDVVFLIVDTTRFRQDRPNWSTEINKVWQPPFKARLLGGKVHFADVKGLAEWNHQQPLPDTRGTFANNDFKGAAAGVRVALKMLTDRAESKELRVFVLWCSDINPAAREWAEEAVSFQPSPLLLWYGYKYANLHQFEKLFGKNRTVSLEAPSFEEINNILGNELGLPR